MLVQKALENVMKNRTILIIAHRLSTVKNAGKIFFFVDLWKKKSVKDLKNKQIFFFADKIICMKDGEVVEQGTHEFLMSQRGTYYNLVNNQIIDETKKCNSQSS